MNPAHDLQTVTENPLVHKAVLEEPGSQGILKTTARVVPQYSGMSFVQFFYPPGDYTNKSFNFWLIGIVRKPYENKFCAFGETRTPARRISAGEVIVIEPGTDYSTKISTSGQVDYLVLTQNRLNQALEAQHKDSLGRTGSGETYFSSPIIWPLIDALISSAHRPNSFDPHHADNFINAVVSGLCQPSLETSSGGETASGGLSSRDINLLDEYIDNAADDPVTNAQMASLVNLPEAVFQKAFKASTGETPYQYVLQRRICLARSLLGAAEQSIAEIAYSCGFSSQSHMTDVFRRRVGATPAAVRKSLLGRSHAVPGDGVPAISPHFGNLKKEELEFGSSHCRSAAN